jgi:hypothetical protein
MRQRARHPRLPARTEFAARAHRSGGTLRARPGGARSDRADKKNLVRTPKNLSTALAVALIAAFGAIAAGTIAGCAHQEYFPNSTVPKTEENTKIIETVEQYRRRLIERNIEGLLTLASEKYFEDSGTPRSDDDYGYEGLKQVLVRRLARLRSLRYEIEYRSIKHNGQRVEVEVFLDGSFELAAPGGERYRRVNDFHRFILERSDEKWKFLSGM